MTGNVDLLQHLAPYVPSYMVALAMTAVILRHGPAFMERWNERLRDKATARAADWSRLTDLCDRHTVEIKALKNENLECHRRLAALEGYNDGRGKAAQDAQVIISTEREIDAAKRKGRPKP